MRTRPSKVDVVSDLGIDAHPTGHHGKLQFGALLLGLFSLLAQCGALGFLHIFKLRRQVSERHDLVVANAMQAGNCVVIADALYLLLKQCNLQPLISSMLGIS